MRFRDLAIVAGVLLLAGFAVADALRGHGSDGPGPGPSVSIPTGIERPPGRPLAVPLPTEGRLLVASVGTCDLHDYDVATAQEVRRLELSSCRFSAAPRGDHIAYGIGGTGFRLIDLADTFAPHGIFRTGLGSVVWSPDGERAAWCDANGAYVRAFAWSSGRLLPRCPVALDPAGKPAYREGRRLVAGGKTVYRAARPLRWAGWSAAGQLVVLERDGTLQRADARSGFLLPLWAVRRRPILAPDGCKAAFQRGRRIEVFWLCGTQDAATFVGVAAAFSPDSRWLAVAARRGVAFYPLERPDRVIRWGVSAVALAWR